MSHSTLMAIGIAKNHIVQKMERYFEHRKVIPYIYKTKDEIIAQIKKRYAERCECLKMYNANPKAAFKKYGEKIRHYLKHIDDPEELDNIADPTEYYHRYTEWERENGLIDSYGNILSNYNPESKWDYFDICRITTIKELKKEAEEHYSNYDPACDSAVWNYVVNNDSNKLNKIAKSTADAFRMTMNAPNREQLLNMYGSEEKYINFKKETYALAYSVLDADGEWYETVKILNFGIPYPTYETEKKWKEEFYKKFIKGTADNTAVIIINCHI